MQKKGWTEVFDPSQAELIVVNSCGFIESAKTESLDAVMSARQSYPKAKILLAGCLAERYAHELKDSLSEADGFFGNGDLSQIYKILDPLMDSKRPLLVPEQKGVCCGDRNLLLPLIRGDLRSRKADEIIEEIKLLVSQGIYEINLIGQDLAAYGTGADDNCFGDGRTHLPNGSPGTEIEGGKLSPSSLSGLARLIKMISQIQGTFAVRLLYIHPDHFNADILPIMKSDSRFLHYFDIPFQSGDDQIISSMHRVGNQATYKNLISTIRSTFPDAAIRTTFMAGFPGESKENAENTLKFLENVTPDWSGCFSYSKEDDTPAYDFKGQVPHKSAEKRAALLVEAQAKITRERLRQRCNQEYDVLIEEVLSQSQENPDEGLAIGRAWFQAPEVDGSVVVRYDSSSELESQAVQVGRLVRVRVLSSGDVDLNGDFLADSPLNKEIKKSTLKFAQEV